MKYVESWISPSNATSTFDQGITLQNCILVTGGAGFIGSNFVLRVASTSDRHIVNLDKLTYAGNLQNLEALRNPSRYTFVPGDICDCELVKSLLSEQRPRAVIHFAAESHVDRSILGPGEFIRTNVLGMFSLLEGARKYWESLLPKERGSFRFLHVSTDEVYGSLAPTDPAFTEKTGFAPNSPYAASKAASDHLVRAYHHTYGVPTLTSNCSNNYGPYQFPEKLIPLTILNAIQGKPIPVYGDGKNVRDWLYVEDHCDAISAILGSGNPGETYNVGGSSERTNIEVVQTICEELDDLLPESQFRPHCALIKFVTDRPGHDRRYAIDASKLRRELGWKPQENFCTGIRKTVEWYLGHKDWLDSVISGAYKEWVAAQYAAR
jgi:dTDP-glucose 4,6-dehydratase